MRLNFEPSYALKLTPENDLNSKTLNSLIYKISRGQKLFIDEDLVKALSNLNTKHIEFNESNLLLETIIEFFEDEQDEKLVEQLINYLKEIDSNLNTKFKLKKLFYFQNSLNPLIGSYFSNLLKLYKCIDNTRIMNENDLELDISWRLELFKFWCTARAFCRLNNLFTSFEIPCCQMGDKKSISRLCAYYNLKLDEIIELISFLSNQITYIEKINFLLPKCKANGSTDRIFAQKLAFLISGAFNENQNSHEKLLLISKVLRLSLKQIFQFTTPELFYHLLITGGRLVKKNEDFTKLNECISLFPAKTFEKFSKPFVCQVLIDFAASSSKNLSTKFVDFLFSFVILTRFCDFHCFYPIVYKLHECFSLSLKNYGGLLLPILKNCFEKLFEECLKLGKYHHLSALSYVAIKLGFFSEIVQNNVQMRSIFSTLSCSSLLDFLNVSSSNLSLENFGEILKMLLEISETSDHPFKRLAIIGIEKLYKFSIDTDNLILSKSISDWKMYRCSPVTLFPYFMELQNISEKLEKTENIISNLRFYSSLYLRSNTSENLLDLLLVFMSGLIEKAQLFHNSNVLRAYENCIDRLLFFSKTESASIVHAYTDIFLFIPKEVANWEKIVGLMSEIDNPSTFSEWIVCVTLKSCAYCQPKESDLFRSILPAMIEPYSLVPIFPIFIVTAHYSSKGCFIKEYFKSALFQLFENDAITFQGVTLAFDVLNEVFDIFSKSNEINATGILKTPTWINQFSAEELSFLFQKCMKMNILKYATFFMQLIWSIDSKKISQEEIYETFTKLDDFRSALSFSSNDNSFNVERSLYYFMSVRQNAIAEAAMKMMSSGPIERFDTIFLKNNILKMDYEVFSSNFEKFSRIAPDRIISYNEIKNSGEIFEFSGLKTVKNNFLLKYEFEHGSNIETCMHSSKTKQWDNFRLLKESKDLRKNRDFENSYYILSKMDFKNDSFWTLKHFMELAHWFHFSGKFNVAIEIFQSLAKEQKNSKLLSKIFRKLAVSMISSRHYSDQEIMDVFEKSAALDRSCAKVSFEIGTFLDSRPQSDIDRTPTILKNFARALLNSRKYDHLIYPRFITIWLNGSQNYGNLISKFVQMASTSQAVSHLSQLISRVGHPKIADASLIEKFLIKVFADYSDITLWKMGSVANSGNEIRKSRILSLLEKVSTNQICSDIKGFLEFCKLLIAISDLSAPADLLKINLSKEVRICKRIMSNEMLLAAPNSVLVYSPENKEGYDYIRGFEDNCVALLSLQRPKKIRFVLNNSKHMTALLKPKDDLRKDSRFMELCLFLNLNFVKLKSRTKYGIKIFAVTPLNDECGIIEWVEHTASFRSILLKSYKSLGISIANRDLKDILAMQISSYEKFVKFFLPKFPPIFMRWFFEKFPSIIRWQNATSDYANSVAVMSMVGYIVGLGDRHGENILFDETTGECVHVDFNCLFDKGKTLEYPEKVPFRLTQNLVHACGTGGIAANFKLASSVAMSIMWDSKRSILTNLETFLHDPLVEWSKSKKIVNQSSDITNEQASKILKIVERKLNGYIDSENFSCEGQVDKLIQYAMDLKKLSEMYIGWSAFL